MLSRRVEGGLLASLPASFFLFFLFHVDMYSFWVWLFLALVGSVLPLRWARSPFRAKSMEGGVKGGAGVDASLSTGTDAITRFIVRSLVCIYPQMFASTILCCDQVMEGTNDRTMWWGGVDKQQETINTAC